MAKIATITAPTEAKAQDPSRHSVRRSNSSSSAKRPDKTPPVFSASKPPASLPESFAIVTLRPLKAPTELRREIRKAQKPGLADCFVQKEPARRLPNLASIPVAVVTSEASAWSMHDHGTVDYLVQAGVRAVHLRLEDHGLRGNGHLMMQERNSDDIAAFLERWISEYVGSRPT